MLSVLDVLTATIGLPWLFASTIILFIIYFTVFRTWNHFSARGLKCIRGWPILGTQFKVFIGCESIGDSFKSIYNAFPNESVIGMYGILGDPVYVIRDIEMIKKITTKDFDSFANHRFHISQESDELFGRTMLVMRDQQWKDARSSASPAFTGRKMRLMLSLVTKCSMEFCDYLKKEIQPEGEVYDFKDLMLRYIANTIGSCAFGLDINSLEDKDTEFLKRSAEVANFDGLQGFKFFGYQAVPALMNFLKVKIMSKENQDYFRKMILKNMEYRKENGIHRPDMINLILEAEKGMLKHSDENVGQNEDIGFATVQESDIGKSTRRFEKWDHDDLVAQCLIFIFGGFNAIPLSQCFMAHELAMNPDIQQKLYSEVKEVHKELGDTTITYEVLQGMKYMDMVVSEVLRRWPLAVAMDRYVGKPYTLEDSSGNKIHLKTGNGIWITTIGIHMDEKYFPNAQKFDPERFSDESKGNIRSGSYLPFGIGPRNCIVFCFHKCEGANKFLSLLQGSRFALLEMKIAFYYLLLNFHLERCEKTQHPLKLKRKTTSMDAEKGFWLKLRTRK